MATTLIASSTDNLSNSTSSILSTGLIRKPPSSAQASKTYKQASTFFLTRRLREAYTTLTPLITSIEDDVDTRNGFSSDPEANAASATPIATAPRSLRIKVWSLYISLLDEIVKLGAEEGKAVFGGAAWRSLYAKTQGEKGLGIWEEIVRRGYGGREGDVDGEVVVNL